MKTRTICITPGRAAPDMTLARPVVTRDGTTLLSAGSVLDTNMLDRLIRRGVEAIWVLTVDARDDETIANELLAAETHVATIFRGQSSQSRAALRAAVLEYRQECAR